MKRLNNFLDKAPLWQIYIFGWLFTGTFIASLFYGFQFIDPAGTQSNLTGINCIKIGAMSGLLFGYIVLLMISMMRKSEVFWVYAKQVEVLINEAKTKEELQSIFNNEFQELRNKSQGGPHYIERNRLYTIIKTKYQYVK